MVWAGLFSRSRRIDTVEALSRFCDRQAAFNCQKNIFEYIRARAASNAQTLFEEPAFARALEEARWRGYPLSLANVLEMTMLFLPVRTGRDEEMERALAMLRRIAAGLMRGYRSHQPLGEEAWQRAADKLDAGLVHAAGLPPRPVKDIPLARVDAFFALIPLHDEIKAPDHASIENNLRINLCRAHEELARRLDATALMREVVAAMPEEAAIAAGISR